MNEKTVRYVGFSISFVIHLLLFVLFYFIQIQQEVVIPEFAEVIVPSSGASAQTDMEQSSSNNVQRASLPEHIELPEKMELKDDEKLSQFSHTRAVEDTKPEFLQGKQIKTPALKADRPLDSDQLFTKKSLPEAGLSRPTLPPLEETASSAGTDVEKVYQIDWEGNFKREVLYEVLPDVRKIQGSSATIRLILFVDRDGSVLRVEPLQKGANTYLENAAIDAVKKWRFNPISQDSTLQKGIITFKFIAK